MKKFFNSLVENCFQMWRMRGKPFPSIGVQPFQGEDCRTSEGEVCTLHNLDRIVRF
jgi:hypothetical protein